MPQVAPTESAMAEYLAGSPSNSRVLVMTSLIFNQSWLFLTIAGKHTYLLPITPLNNELVLKHHQVPFIRLEA